MKKIHKMNFLGSTLTNTVSRQKLGQRSLRRGGYLSRAELNFTPLGVKFRCGVVHAITNPFIACLFATMLPCYLRNMNDLTMRNMTDLTLQKNGLKKASTEKLSTCSQIRGKTTQNENWQNCARHGSTSNIFFFTLLLVQCKGIVFWLDFMTIDELSNETDIHRLLVSAALLTAKIALIGNDEFWSCHMEALRAVFCSVLLT